MMFFSHINLSVSGFKPRDGGRGGIPNPAMNCRAKHEGPAVPAMKRGAKHGILQKYTSLFALPYPTFPARKSFFVLVRRHFSNLKNGFVHERNDFSVLKNAFVHERNGFSNLKNGFVHERNDFSVLKNGFVHERNDFSVLKNGFVHDQNDFSDLKNASDRDQKGFSDLKNGFYCGKIALQERFSVRRGKRRGNRRTYQLSPSARRD